MPLRCLEVTGIACWGSMKLILFSSTNLCADVCDERRGTAAFDGILISLNSWRGPQNSVNRGRSCRSNSWYMIGFLSERGSKK